MSELAKIERLADALPSTEKRQLLLFLAARLRAEGAIAPEPRDLDRQQIEAWIEEDEADLARLRQEG